MAIYFGAGGGGAAAEKPMMGTVDTVVWADGEAAVITVVMDGARTATPALAGRHYRPRSGDRVKLIKIAGQLVIEYAIDDYEGIPCGLYGRTVDITATAGILPMNMVYEQSKLPAAIDAASGLVRMTERGLFLIDGRAAVSAEAGVRARILALDAVGAFVDAGVWTEMAGRTIAAGALLRLDEGDGIGLWIDGAYTAIGGMTQLMIQRMA